MPDHLHEALGRLLDATDVYVVARDQLRSRELHRLDDLLAARSAAFDALAASPAPVRDGGDAIAEAIFDAVPLPVDWTLDRLRELIETTLAASAPPARDPDDDEITRRLHDLAENGSWDDPRALLARVELYAEQERMPSGGLRADIEMYLRKAASSPPAREWRVVRRTEDGAAGFERFRSEEEDEARDDLRLAGRRYKLQSREVGPWVDVPAEGEGA